MPNKEYLRDHRGGRTNMAYKCKQFKTVNLTCYGHYTHVCRVSRVIGINTENKICLPNKEYISGHWWWRIKYVCQMHITHTYYCWAQSLMNYLFIFLFSFSHNEYWCLNIVNPLLLKEKLHPSIGSWGINSGKSISAMILLTWML